VGLDVLAAVATTAYDRCLDDEKRDIYEIPPILQTMLDNKWLGQKTKGGFYKKEGKEIFALDLQTLEYAPKTKPRMDGIGVARRYTDLGKRLSALVYNPDAAGKFAWEVTIGTLAYAANRVGEIADDIVQIDQAMSWGFAWDMGPFEIWDAIGLEKSVRRMKAEGKPIPAMVEELLAAGQTSFYGRDAAGVPLYFDRNLAAPAAVSEDSGTIVLADQKAAGKEILRNWSASLVDLDDGVACVEFHSALQADLNPIDGAIIDILGQSLHYAQEQKLKGLVISHDGTHFCAGANLALILELAKRKQFDIIDQVSKTLQDITQGMKYAPFPVVAAPFSLTLGGGFEMVAPCNQVVALAELYCGAVEVGVGLIPGAGGNLRVLSHFMEKMPPKKLGPMMAVQKAFETVGFAKISTSAHHAKALGYLREDNMIVLSRRHQIAMAKQAVLDMAPGYTPPEPEEFVLPGKGGQLAIKTAITGYRMSGKISKHDAHIAKGLAHVLTGGSRANGSTPVDEQYLLDLEREVFVSLAGERLSQDRMAHMLKTGKPLRN
jgi:3-hydroxyacyl-CoA dehydrogenase